jgi:hypothetical protein
LEGTDSDPVYTVSGRIWDWSEIRPFSPVYTRIRPVRGSQIRPVLWFSCVYTAEFQIGSKFVRYRVNGVSVFNVQLPLTYALITVY